MRATMNDSRHSQQGSGFVLGVLSGGAVGFLVLVLVLFTGGYAYVKKQVREAKQGWNLVPVVVAAQDIPEDTLVTYEQISQRSVPEQFVTSSVVKPDSASYIVNQKLLVPVQAGDPMLWTHFETKKTTATLMAARDIPVGGKLTEADVEVKALEEEHMTPSYVKDAERPQVVGRTVTAPFRKGDAILWTHFQNEPPPVVGTPVP